MSQLPPQEQPPFPLSETLIAAEYSALREELLKLTETQFQLIIVALSAFVTRIAHSDSCHVQTEKELNLRL